MLIAEANVTGIEIPNLYTQTTPLPDHSLFRFSSRAYLFWLLSEEAMRQEVVYTQLGAQRWNSDLDLLSNSIKPIEEYSRKVIFHHEATPHPLYGSITEIRRKVQTAMDLLNSKNFPPTDKISPTRMIYGALNQMREGSTEWSKLIRGISSDTVTNSLPQISVKDFANTRNLDSTLHLHLRNLSYASNEDDDARCNSVRSANLAIYYALIFNPRANYLYHLGAIEEEGKLADGMEFGTQRNYVNRQRERLMSLHGQAFEKCIEDNARQTIS